MSYLVLRRLMSLKVLVSQMRKIMHKVLFEVGCWKWTKSLECPGLKSVKCLERETKSKNS